MARALMMNPKLVAKQQEKALIEAEKRVKQFEKIHKKSLKKAEKEEKQMEKIRSKLIVAPIEANAKIIPSATNYTNINQSPTNHIGTNYTERLVTDPNYSERLVTDPNQSVTTLTGTNTKKTGRLFQTNTSRNLIKSLSNINPLESSSQSLSGQTTCCHGTTHCKDCLNNRSEEDEDGLEVVECQKPSNLNVRGIMSQVLKNNRSKEGLKEGSKEGSRFSVGDCNQIFRSGENLDRLSQTGSNLIRSKSGSTIQLFESKLAPKVTPKTFSQIVNGDRSNYSNGVNYTNYKPKNDQSSSSSISSSWKGTISKLNKLTINTSLGAVSKRILHRKASTGSTNSGTSNRSNQSNEGGVILKQLLIKSGSLNNLSTIYCTSSDSSSSNRIKTNGKERNGFTLVNGTTSSKSSFSSGNNNEVSSLTNYSHSSSDEFKMIEKINEDSGIGSSAKVRPLSGLRSSLDPEQVLYVRKNPVMESIDEQLINSGLLNNGLTNPGLIHSSLYMSHKMNNSGVNSMYHSMNSLSMKSQPWIEMFQKKTQL